VQEGAPGWRDLGRTKWRLAKGEEQLEATYRCTVPPHHISDEALSELAVCIYQVPWNDDHDTKSKTRSHDVSAAWGC